MLEIRFQANLIRDLKQIFVGCIILKNDPTYIQGIPDLIILYEDKWAALECKRGMHDPVQPNQEYYITTLNQMSFAKIICPENREEIINGLQQAFGLDRPSRISRG
jgi:hypothetical protein